MLQIEHLGASDYAPRKDLRYVDVFDLHSLYDELAFRASVVLVGPKGVGKAQPLDARVLTPSGFVPMREVGVGTLVVNGSTGGVAQVTEVHPQGVKEVYRVTMSDGAETECCANHLWKTLTVADALAGKPPQVRPLTDIRDTLYYQETLSEKMTKPTRNHRIPDTPLAILLDGTRCGNLPLDPYLLGILIGDGALTSSTIQFHNSERDIVERVQASLPSGDGLTFNANTNVGTIHRRATHDKSRTALVLRDLGLLGRKSTEKFIPQEYLYGPATQRLALLRGLCDTDGYVIASGQRVEFTTSSERLHGDFLFLARSLGAIIRHSSRIPHYTYKGVVKQGSRNWRHSVYFPNGICPVSSAKHLARWREDQRPYYRTIDHIEPVGTKECQCITIDTPDGLYITDDFIVTHNSLGVAAYAAKIDCPIITFDCSEDVRRSHLIGKFILRGGVGDQVTSPFILGPLTTAFEIANHVGRCIINLEEINGLVPQMMKVLNPITDFRCSIAVPEAKKVFRLEPGAKLWFTGTMNTLVHGGVYAMNEDLKSRVRLIPLSYPKPEQEKTILREAIPETLRALGKQAKGIVSDVITLAHETRQKSFEYALSTRDVVQILEDIAALGKARALWISTGKFEEEDRKTYIARIQSIFGIRLGW